VEQDGALNQRRRSWPAAVAAAVMVVPMLAVTACGRDLPAAVQVGTTTVAPAERVPMPDISGTTLDGSTLDLASLRGKVVVLNSWASWCEPCKKEIPDFVKLASDVDPAKVAIVGLNVSDEKSAASAFVQDYKMTYPSIVDESGSMLATIPGVPPKALPSTVVIDGSGRIAAQVVGAANAEELSGIVASVGAEKPTS
jgi:thiol-disulfide isomerase/thioredoxin